MPSRQPSGPASEDQSQLSGIAKLSSIARATKARARHMPGSLIAGMVLLSAAFITIGTQQAVKLVSADGPSSQASGPADNTRSTTDQAHQDGPAPDSQDASAGNNHNPSSDGSKTKTESRTNISVNGEHITVPENGSYSRTVNDESGSTSVHVESRSSNSSDGGASSSSNNNVTLRVHSESSSSNWEDSE